MTRAWLDKRLTTLERLTPRTPDPVVAEAERWCSQVLGCTFDDLDSDDFARVEQLLNEAPDFAHPLLLRAVLGRPEDREPAEPPDVRTQWQRRRWGYLVAADDPEAIPLCRQLEAWATDPGRAYLGGADLRLMFVTLGVEWADTSFFELRRLAQRDQAPHRGGRHLPQRGRDHPPGRGDPARAERRVGCPARPLHDPGNHRTNAR